MSSIPIQPFTVIEPWRFEAITPSQFITMTMQNPLNKHRLLHRLLIRIAVLDSPAANADDDSPVIAAMIVPNSRETDWIFCSESGHYQLLFKFPKVSRLILIGNNPLPIPAIEVYKRPPVADTVSEQIVINNDLKSLLMSLHPKVSFNNGLPETLFLSYDDEVAYRVTVGANSGQIVGPFVVEDIELFGGDLRNKQIRRRLRYKRMPNFVQSQALLVPIIPYNEATTQTDLQTLRRIENSDFEADSSILIDQNLIHMVACLFKIVSHLNERVEQRLMPTALCLGVGGGVLLTFLDTTLGFQVTGVEADEAVLTAATEHFGFNKYNKIRLVIADVMEWIQNFLPQKPEGDNAAATADDNDGDLKVDEGVQGVKFDVVMVDLDSIDSKNEFSAPPPAFVKKSVFEGLRSILDDNGALIINVVSSSEVFFATLVNELKEVFHKVYGIDVVIQQYCVVMATVSATPSIDDNNEFLRKLKAGIPGIDMDSIVEF